MKTKQLIDRVTEDRGWERETVSDVVLWAINVIAEELIDGGRVKLHGLGTLSVNKRPDCLVMRGSGIGLNGAIVETRRVRFTSDDDLVDAINAQAGEMC